VPRRIRWDWSSQFPTPAPGGASCAETRLAAGPLLAYAPRMNFFGHAAIARRHSASQRLQFGAMLPDFVGMIGASLPAARCPEIRAGVSHHHFTDEVFHQTATFRRLSGVSAQHLQSFGLRRGSALAVGHVGVELLIDCTIGRDPVVCDQYQAALRAGSPESLRGDLEWSTLEHRERFATLHTALLERGLAVVDPNPERLALRLQRVLARRPRLALEAADCDLVAAWARGTMTVVADAVPVLIEELLSGFARRERPETVEGAAQ
jgi:hypothetical protein